MHKYNVIVKYANMELINKCEEKKDIVCYGSTKEKDSSRDACMIKRVY